MSLLRKVEIPVLNGYTPGPLKREDLKMSNMQNSLRGFRGESTFRSGLKDRMFKGKKKGKKVSD